MIELPNAIEAILFYHAEPMTVKRLSSVLKRPEKDIRDALFVLTERLTPTGLRLLTLGEEVSLGTSPDASLLIEALTKDELSKDLSKASLETLAIVLYRSPITRAEIDYIRGVNSTFILRNLLVRGLVEKIDNPQSQRSFHYKPTLQLLQFLGITQISELPEYSETLDALQQFVTNKEESDDTHTPKPAQVAVESTEIADVELESYGVMPEVAIEDEADLDYQEDQFAQFDPQAQTDESQNVEADIAEEDLTATNFIDKQLTDHLRADEEGV